MQVGACLITTGEAPERPGLREMAQRIERTGASSLWVNDHLVFRDEITSTYPYSVDGNATWEPDLAHYESLSALAYVGAVTERIRLGTAVLILPQRNVIQLAKTTATIDRLTAGRLLLGVGIGWQREEMEALGYRFGSRVRRAEEMIGGLRNLWTGRTTEMDGEEVSLSAGLVSQPRPFNEGGIPILVGGMVPKAIDRAARLGDGWVGVTGADQLDPADLARKINELDRLRCEYGREGRAFRKVLRLGVPELGPGQVERLIERLRGVGLDEIALEFDWSDPDLAEAALSRAIKVNAEGSEVVH